MTLTETNLGDNISFEMITHIKPQPLLRRLSTKSDFRRRKNLTVYPGFFPDKEIFAEYTCPACGAKLADGDTLAKNTDGDMVGCNRCIRYYEIWEILTDEIQ